MKRTGYLVCVAGVALLGGAGCPQQFQATTGTTTMGSGGSTTSSSSGTAGQSVSSGTGGMACVAGACAAGQYCNSASGSCEACTQLDRVHFADPAPLGLVATGYNALYPRVDGDSKDLYLDLQNSSSHLDQLGVAHATAGTPPWPSASLLPQLGGTHNDRGPLYLADPSLLTGLVDPTVSTSMMPVLLFDSDRMGGRLLFAVSLQGTTPYSLLLPSGATQASRVALAMSATQPRLFWMGDAAGSTGIHMLTAPLTPPLTSVPVAITLDGGCAAPGADTPWVTPAGTLMLFASPAYSASPACAVQSAAVTHLYQVQLDGSGQPTAPAEPVFAGDTTSIDATPSLTPDACTLLFARVDTSSGIAAIYSASRD